VCEAKGGGGKGQGVGHIQTKPTWVVSHYGFAIYIKKYLKAKEE
jgi:hypothetical protein